MGTKFASFAASRPTLGTLKLFLDSVAFHVANQVCAVPEALSARRAVKRLLPSVGFHVGIKADF